MCNSKPRHSAGNVIGKTVRTVPPPGSLRAMNETTPDTTNAARATAPHWSRLRFPLVQAVMFILVSTVLREVLRREFAWHIPMGWGEKLRLHAGGALLDALVAACVFLPSVLWLAVARERWLNGRAHRWVLLGGTWLWWFLTLFLFQAEFYFFKEYNSRFNTVAVDYLHYWTEVSASVRENYPVPRIVAFCVAGAAGVVALAHWLAPVRTGAVARQRWIGVSAWCAVAAALGWGAASLRGGAGATERVVNEISSNGLFSGAVALWTRDLDFAHFFPTLPREEAFARARRLLDTPGAQWSADPFSLQRRTPGDAARPRLNVILLLEESLGSEFLGCLNLKDGVPPKKSLTPNLDALAAREGLLFTNLYADGNRTIRGMEAVLASIPPLPGDSILSRTRTENCETLAQLLRRDGYSTTFIYPGRGFFDGLGRFALGNGFDRFIEQKDFVNPVFTNTWGHCDEDLYDRVLAEARAAHASGRPFFIGALSVSNHLPFTYPEGRIPEPPTLHSRKFAVKYVDYALGRFFAQAKGEPFWNDTVFAIVADHGARVYGSQTVPIRSYEIPLLIAGPATVRGPSRVNTLGCQLDIAPTLLGLIGRPYDTTFYGRDLLAPAPRRALLNHNRSIAIYRDQRLVTLSLNKVAELFTGDPKAQLTRAAALDAEAREMHLDATALFQTADDLYMGRRYRVTPPPAPATNP